MLATPNKTLMRFGFKPASPKKQNVKQRTFESSKEEGSIKWTGDGQKTSVIVLL